MVSGDVLKLECGALVVGIPAGGLTPTAEALDKASEGAVSRWIEAGDIHPCVGKVAVFRDFPGCKAERVVFVGLGKCKARDFQRVLKLGIDNAYLGKEVVLSGCLTKFLNGLPNSPVLLPALPLIVRRTIRLLTSTGRSRNTSTFMFRMRTRTLKKPMQKVYPSAWVFRWPNSTATCLQTSAHRSSWQKNA